MTTTSQAPDTPDTPLTEAGGSATTPPTPPSSPPALSPVELSRWAWRQLTSMRTALVLLFLLALTAVPGSVVPQENIDASKVLDWKQDHPGLTPIYDRLGLFSVYSSPWFSAVYLLLMISLVGCVVPRLRVYWRGMRAQPPRAPRHLSRLPESRSVKVAEDADAVLARAAAVLRRRRYRVAVTPAEGGGGAVSAEKGYLREAGNLLFHFSVLVVLVGFGYGQLFGYKGGVITVVGRGFSNTATQYDDLAPGRLFDVDNLSWLTFTVDDFHVKWLTSGPQMGQPSSFDADITYQDGPDAKPQRDTLSVNHPLSVGGTKVFLVGHGYAPVVTVRGADGKVAYDHVPVPFLPQDATFKSFGVIKSPQALPQQLGFEGYFFPTYGFTVASGPFSQFPDALDPRLVLTPYHGDLGLDDDRSQSVYELDKAGLKPYPSKGTSNPDLLLTLKGGDTAKLPGGGSISFDGLRPWVKLQISHQPGTPVALAGVLLAIAGLMGSLFIRPRRAWVRVVPGAPADAAAGPPGDDGPGSAPRRTVVELAGLDRTSGGDLAAEVDAIERLVVTAPAAAPPETPAPHQPPAQEDTP